MSDVLIIAAFISFVAFLCAGARSAGKYAAIAG
jgi:hypothetical protein